MAACLLLSANHSVMHRARQGQFKKARIAASGARNLFRCPNLENFLAE